MKIVAIIAAIIAVVGIGAGGALVASGRVSLPFLSKESSAQAQAGDEEEAGEESGKDRSLLGKLMFWKKDDDTDGGTPGGSEEEILPDVTVFPGVEARELQAGDYAGVDYHLWDGRLVIEQAASDGWGRYKNWDGPIRVISIDLATGEEAFTITIDVGENPGERDYYDEKAYSLRPVYETPGNICVVTQDEYREYDPDGELVVSYPVPDKVKYWGENREQDPLLSVYGPHWDLRPELNLMVWCDPDGLWTADVNGENARLILSNESNNWQYEVIDYTDPENFGEWGRSIFRSPRIMNGGKTVSVDGSTIYSQDSRQVHRVISLEDGEDLGSVGYPLLAIPFLDRPDDTNIIVGFSRISAVTGQVDSVTRSDRGSGLDSAVTGDFDRFFGGTIINGFYTLMTYTADDRKHGELILTAPIQAPSFDPYNPYESYDPYATEPEDDGTSYKSFSVIAADSSQAVCRWQRGEESGLLLVTVPED